MLRGFPWLSHCFVMPPIEARALGAPELHGKPVDPNSVISPRLLVLAIVLVMVTLFLPTSVGSR